MKEILQKETDLQEIVQLVGKDSLSEDQKCTLEIAKIIREDFLQQNGFSEWDYKCPLHKTLGMMKCIVKFHDDAQRILEEGSSGEHRVTWGAIMKDEKLKLEYKNLTEMKFVSPIQQVDFYLKTFEEQKENIAKAFEAFQDGLKF